MFSKSADRPDASGEASVYERVLGDEFASLHPQLRAYFGAIPPGQEGRGSGVFREAGLRRRALRPLFVLAARAGVAFPEWGRDVPFDVRNTRDADGSLRAVRTFRFAGATRVMTDRMWAAEGGIVDALGHAGALEVELAVAVRGGALHMRSRRLALRVRGRRLPLPRLVAVTLTEEAAEGEGVQRVAVRVRVPLLGDVYGYDGTFTYAVTATTPTGVSVR